MTKSSSAKHIVLYADDDNDDLQLVLDAFSPYSSRVEVVTVKDGTEVLSFLSNLSPSEVSPCLIILDINMPRMSGKETLMHLRKMDRFKSVPVMLFTTSSLGGDRDFAARYDAGFLTKPIDLRQMQATTSQFIDHCSNEVQENIRMHADEKG
jgi:CheY-like chemotaxis protein